MSGQGQQFPTKVLADQLTLYQLERAGLAPSPLHITALNLSLENTEFDIFRVGKQLKLCFLMCQLFLYILCHLSS